MNRLALDLVACADRCDFGNRRMRTDCFFNLSCPEPVPADIDNVVRTSEDKEIAVRVLRRIIKGRVKQFARKPPAIVVFEEVVIVPNGRHTSGRQRQTKRKNSLFSTGERFTGAWIDNPCVVPE